MFNNDIGHATLGLARREAQKSLVHHFIMVEFVYPTKSQSNRRAVGQTSGGLNPRSSPSADDPRQFTSVPKKPQQVSCEESHKFLQLVKCYFSHSSYPGTQKLVLQIPRFYNSTVKQGKDAKITQDMQTFRNKIKQQENQLYRSVKVDKLDITQSTPVF